jgi:hypothetical protein
MKFPGNSLFKFLEIPDSVNEKWFSWVEEQPDGQGASGRGEEVFALSIGWSVELLRVFLS